MVSAEAFETLELVSSFDITSQRKYPVHFDAFFVLVCRNITLHLLGNWLALILSPKLLWFTTFQKPLLVLWPSVASESRPHFVKKILTKSMLVWEWISTTMVLMNGFVFAWTTWEWFSFALPLVLWSFCQVLLLSQVYPTASLSSYQLKC